MKKIVNNLNSASCWGLVLFVFFLSFLLDFKNWGNIEKPSTPFLASWLGLFRPTENSSESLSSALPPGALPLEPGRDLQIQPVAFCPSLSVCLASIKSLRLPIWRIYHSKSLATHLLGQSVLTSDAFLNMWLGTDASRSANRGSWTTDTYLHLPLITFCPELLSLTISQSFMLTVFKHTIIL